MKDYFFRCAQSQAPMLLQAAITLGVLDATHKPVAPSTVWDVIGSIQWPEDTAPLLDPTGVPYWHANLRYDGDLKAEAEALYAVTQDPVLGAALAELPALLILDEEGVSRMPNRPARVFL